MNLNFIFESSDHLRYQNKVLVSGPHGGARRAVKVEPNISGNKGVSVTIYNLDGNHPISGKNIQMTPKQMEIIEQKEDSIMLRGYGFDNTGASFADYGLTIRLDHGQVDQCTLHMFDRGVDIKYLKG